MSTQLALITTPVEEPNGTTGPGTTPVVPGTAPTPRTAGRAATTRGRSGRRGASRRGVVDRLDRRTIETGRDGLAAARAALQQANDRVRAREDERLRRREEDLAREADRRRHPAGRAA